MPTENNDEATDDCNGSSIDDPTSTGAMSQSSSSRRKQSKPFRLVAEENGKVTDQELSASQAPFQSTEGDVAFPTSPLTGNSDETTPSFQQNGGTSVFPSTEADDVPDIGPGPLCEPEISRGNSHGIQSTQLESRMIDSQSPLQATDKSVNLNNLAPSGADEQRSRIFHRDAYCEICQREFCNKYFLRTHKANKHGIFSEDSPPSSTVVPSMDTLPTMVPLPPALGQQTSEDSSQKISCSPLNLSVHPDSTTTGPSQGQVSCSSYSSNDSHEKKASSPPNISADQRLTPNSGSSPPSVSSSTLEDYCDICRKRFCNKYYLKKHLTDVHGIPTPPSSNPLPSSKSLSSVAEQLGASRCGLYQPYNLKPDLSNSLDSNLRNSLPMSMGFPAPANLMLMGMSAAAAAMNPLLPFMLSSQHMNFPMSNYLNASSGVNKPASTFGAGDQTPKSANDLSAKQENSETPLLNTSNVKPDNTGGDTKPITEYGEMKPKESKDFLVQNLINANSPLLKHERTKAMEQMSVFENVMAAKMADRVMCDICNKEVCNKYFLKSHKQRIHGIQPERNTSNRGRPPKHDPRQPEQENQSAGMSSPQGMVRSPFANSELGSNTRSSSVEQNIAGDQPSCGEALDLHTRNSPPKPLVNPIKPDMSTDSNSIETPNGQRAWRWKETANSMARVTCDICNKELCNKYFLRTHKAKRHGVYTPQFSPPVCNPGAMFSDLQSPYGLPALSSASSTSGLTSNSIDVPITCNGSDVVSHLQQDGQIPPLQTNANLSNGAIDIKHMPDDLPPAEINQSKSFDNGPASPENHAGASDNDLENRYFVRYPEVCKLCNCRFKSIRWLQLHIANEHAPSNVQGSHVGPEKTDSDSQKPLTDVEMSNDPNPAVDLQTKEKNLAPSVVQKTKLLTCEVCKFSTQNVKAYFRHKLRKHHSGLHRFSFARKRHYLPFRSASPKRIKYSTSLPGHSSSPSCTIGTPCDLSSKSSFIMQPFTLTEKINNHKEGTFVSSVVYLPVSKKITGNLDVTFQLSPVEN